MENKDKIGIIIAVANLLAVIFLGISAYTLSLAQNSLSQSQYQLELSKQRANMSILVSPQFNQNWAFVANGAYLTVNGTLVNEGTRRALVESMELSAIYHFSDGTPYSITVDYSDLAKYCKMNNTIIAEKQESSFSIGMFIQSSTILVTQTAPYSSSNGTQSLSIGNSRSDNFVLSVTYSDGLGKLQSEQEF